MISYEMDGKLIQTGETKCNLPLGVELVYDPDWDPFAVQMIISGNVRDSVTSEPEVVWVFDRELLANGAHSWLITGLGDVKIRNMGYGDVLFCLGNCTGHADIALPFDQVTRFIDETFREMPPKDVDLEDHIDEAIREILG